MSRSRQGWRFLLAATMLAIAGSTAVVAQPTPSTAAVPISAPLAATPQASTPAVAYGSSHCVVMTDGTVRCWATNYLEYQLNLYGNLPYSLPRTIPGLTGVSALSEDFADTCAVRTDGTVWCWGSNLSGASGDGTTTNHLLPVQVPGITTAVSVSVGEPTCAVLADRTVRCWGNNWQGELGIGTSSDVPTQLFTPVQVAGLTDVVAVSTASQSGHACAVRGDHTVWCWGANTVGQVGDGTTENALLPVQVALADVAEVATGSVFTCARLTSGSVRCWGDNQHGQLGLAPSAGSSTPVAVPGVDDATAITASNSHACVMRADGSVWCWGYGDELGTAWPPAVPPTIVAGVRDASMISAGEASTCAVDRSGGLLCWGRSVLGTFTPSALPVAVTRPGAAVTPLPAPARLLDTRPGFATIDGQDAGIGRRAAGSVTKLQVTGRAGVPAGLLGAVGAVLTLTAVDPEGGWVTAWPCGRPQPNTSNLNAAAGTTVANTAFVRLAWDATGTICLYTSGATHLVVDVTAYYGAASAFWPLEPIRVVDTRPGFTTADGLQAGGTPFTAGFAAQIAGRAGLPGQLDTVALNVTITGANQPGWLTAWPCGRPEPMASILNFGAHATVAAGVLLPVGDNGSVCFASSTHADLIVDVDGYQHTTVNAVPLTPARLLDTRPSFSTVDGQGAGAGRRNAGAVTTLHVAGRADVPTDANTVTLTVAAVDPASTGWLTVWPCDQPQPNASSLNTAPRSTIANTVVTALAADGTVCIFTSTTTHLLADIAGWTTAA